MGGHPVVGRKPALIARLVALLGGVDADADAGPGVAASAVAGADDVEVVADADPGYQSMSVAKLKQVSFLICMYVYAFLCTQFLILLLYCHSCCEPGASR